MKISLFKRVMVFLVVLSMLSVLFGCGGTDKQATAESSKVEAQPETTAAATAAATTEAAPKEPVTVKFPTFLVGVNSGAPWFAKMVENFNQKYGKDVKIEVEEIPGDQAYVDKIKILISSNELPDVIFAGGYNLVDLALQKNQVVDLTPYLDADPQWKGIFDPRSLEFNTRNGKIYSLPYSKQLMGYYYNKELFAKAGITAPANTWDEFYQILDKLLAAGITPMSMDTADTGWLTSLWLCSMIGTAGESGNKFMNTVQPSNYEVPEFINAAKNIQLLFSKYTTKDAVGGKYENGANNFLSGKTAIIANGPWMLTDFADTTKVQQGFIDKVGIAIYPDGGVFNAPMLGMFVASKDKEHADAAVTVVKYFTSLEGQSLGLEMIGQIPDSPAVTITDQMRSNSPLLAQLIELAKTAKYTYNDYQALWFPNILDTMSTDYPALALKKMTPEDFAKRLAESAAKNK